MCGIFGYFNIHKKKSIAYQAPFSKLLSLASERGKEASGAANLFDDNSCYILRSDLVGKKLIPTAEYQNFLAQSQNKLLLMQIGHSRLATHGSQLIHTNNQPVLSDDTNLMTVHNGIIAETETWWNAIKNEQAHPVLDTKVLLEYLSFLAKNNSLAEAIKQAYQEMKGSASLAIMDLKQQTLYLSTNTGSLYYYHHPLNGDFYFASEKIFLLEALSNIEQFKHAYIKHLNPQQALSINTGGICPFSLVAKEKIKMPILTTHHNEVKIKFKDFSLEQNASYAQKHYKIINSLQELKKHDFDYKKIYALQRCKKCILPITTPFIEFDAQGICNFCNEHQAISVKGRESLENILKRYRKNNGEPDCLVAFSGGRDSSYGLHYVKKELGMQPLAYTYDWGMVTDLARRNQARILGKLGVEHLLVSADITLKRKHIRENILAWTKKPHLGMVPLFMEGDKQCEFYADRLMKKYQLQLMFFFRGNELEKDEFKTGHCGVKDADPGGVIHHLAPLKKIKLLSFYATQYFLNPTYFNSSFWDTSLGFFTTYIQPHNYLYLWHYIRWDEQQIISTLKNEYEWETPKETPATWRTDDGTSAFYNYIYYQGQGFTENDSFRSRQIREGLLSRDEALALVHEENKPRYQALQWYFDMVSLEGSKVLEVVDFMKKLY